MSPRPFLRTLCTSLALATVGTAAPEISPHLRTFADNRNVGLPPLALDFTRATVVATPAAGPETKAIQLLVDEAEQRTLVRWPVVSQPTAASTGATIIVGTFAQLKPLLAARNLNVTLDESAVAAEGYQLATVAATGANAAPTLVIAGKDARGVLFGIGHALRKFHFGPARAGLMAPLNLATSPKYPIRGHQLGFRPKPNTYSGWTIEMWERYIRELALFGTNAIELIPPRSDDAADSLHFPEPQLDMMRKMSQVCADYGLDVWVWYPALDSDYSKPEIVRAAIDEWAVVFRTLPRIDAVLVPGGDPGHTPPELMFPLLEKQTASLRRFHPQATMWLSPQGFTAAQLDYYFDFLRDQKPAWFAGTVFAPWVNMDLSEFRRRTPPQYRVRFYPDITHTRGAQYPVNDWHFAFSITQGREIVCPRPSDMALMVRRLVPHTDGSVAYSEGHHDDVNKILWSALHWDPDAAPLEILRDYGRVFISERLAEDFAQGILALERNWRGSPLTNDGIVTTLAQFQAMERAATPQYLLNWRFQMALYRAYYDAYVRARLRHETQLEELAHEALRATGPRDTLTAMAEAESILDRALTHPVALDLRTRIFQLAEAQYQSMRAKLSVPLYRAISQGRGANLDSIDWPLNSAPWLKARFAAIRQLPDESARRSALDVIVNWTNPGPGGFYDDLGNPLNQPHLVRGAGYDRDPNYIRTALMTHSGNSPGSRPQRVTQLSHAGTLTHEFPLTLRYTNLDPAAEYQVKFSYAETAFLAGLRFTADGTHELQTTAAAGRGDRAADGGEPLTFDIPRTATADGALTLEWSRIPGRSGSGRGMVSEVWLIKKPLPPVDVHQPRLRANPAAATRN